MSDKEYTGPERRLENQQLERFKNELLVDVDRTVRQLNSLHEENRKDFSHVKLDVQEIKLNLNNLIKNTDTFIQQQIRDYKDHEDRLRLIEKSQITSSQMEENKKSIADHEVRIREVEKFQNKALGTLVAVQIIISIVSSIIIAVVLRHI